MSDKKSNSSKKSKESEEQKEVEIKKKQKKFKPLKLPKTSKLGKLGVKNKVKDFSSRQRAKVNALKSKVKTSFYDKIVHQEVYIDGQVPKSYSEKFFGKFFGLYLIFILYSALLVVAINIPESNWIHFLMFGNPFAFSNTIVAFFLVLSFLFSIDKVRIFIFEKKTAIKQLILYIGLISLLYILFLYISTGINFMTYLLALAMIWLILLSSRFYIYSRKFSTKIEARFIRKYSIIRRGLAIIIPFFILGVLVVLALFYRSFLVFLFLCEWGLKFNPPHTQNILVN